MDHLDKRAIKANLVLQNCIISSFHLNVHHLSATSGTDDNWEVKAGMASKYRHAKGEYDLFSHEMFKYLKEANQVIAVTLTLNPISQVRIVL